MPQFERVARATTLPILILGGESHGEPKRTVGEVAEAMKAGSNVRGALVGRNVIWPGEADPQAVAVAIARVVRGASPEEGIQALSDTGGLGIAQFRSLFR